MPRRGGRPPRRSSGCDKSRRSRGGRGRSSGHPLYPTRPAAGPAAARRFGRHLRRRRRSAGACGRWTRSAGSTARRVRPRPAARHVWPGRQVNDHRVTARRVSAGRRKGTGATAGVPAAPVLRGEMRDCSRRPCWVGLCYGSACPRSHDLVLLAARNGQGTLRHALATETGRLIVAWTGLAVIWPPTPGGLARRARRGVMSACGRISRSPR
jgi:hypothetical protein